MVAAVGRHGGSHAGRGTVSRATRPPSASTCRPPGRVDHAGRGGRDHAGFLGVTVKCFPDAGPQPRAESEGRVRAALTGAQPDPDPRTRLLTGLLGPADLVRRLVEPAARKRAEASSGGGDGGGGSR